MQKKKNLETIFFGITNICNSKCLTCDIGLSNRGISTDSLFLENFDFDRKKYASTSLIDTLYDQLQSLDPEPDVYITGGEPLISDNFLYFLNRFKDYKGKLSLVTNGFFLDNYVDAIISSNLDSVNISLDGLHATHDYIRGIEGMYSKITSSLKKLSDQRKNSINIKINVNFTISRANYREIYAFAKEIVLFGVDRIDFLHPQYVTPEMVSLHNTRYPHMRVGTRMFYNGEMYNIPFDELVQVIKRTKNEFLSKVCFFPDLPIEKLKTYYNQPIKFPEERICSGPWKSLEVIQNGDCIIGTPCVPNKLGNIKSTPISKIWIGERINRFRTLISEIGSFPICSKCCMYYYD